jgi:hypothetical protein
MGIENFEQHPGFSPSDQELGPNKISSAGFLKEGQTLEKVVKRDKEALDILGYTPQEVADLLGPIIEKSARSGKFEYVAPNGKIYIVESKQWRGFQQCPWKDHGEHGSIDMYITEKERIEKPVHIPGLLKHLIEKHDFFEGGDYRVAPETIVEMFGQEKKPGSIEKAKNLKL